MARRMILTAAQCRKARAALGWSMRDLHAKSAVSIGTISRLEHGAKLEERTLADIKRALADGLKLKHSKPARSPR